VDKAMMNQTQPNAFHRTAFSTFTPLKGATKTQNSPDNRKKQDVMEQNPYSFGRQIISDYQD